MSFHFFSFPQTKILRLVLACAALASISSCGHKTALTLEGYEVPAAPENLSAAQRENMITLSWTYRQSETVKGYLVERQYRQIQAPGKEKVPGKMEKRAFKRVTRVAGTSYSETVVFGNLYTYEVRVISVTGAFGKPAVISVPALPPPPPPKGLSFAIGNSLLKLKWEAEGFWNGEQVFYNVYGGPAPRPENLQKPAGQKTPAREKAPAKTAIANAAAAAFPRFNAAPLKESSFSVAPNPGTGMVYCVKALLGGKFIYEGWGASITVRREDFVPSRPEKPDVLAVPGGIRLVWQPNPETWVSGYRVYRVISGAPREIGFTGVPTFFDRGASFGTYMISAAGSVSESRLSEPSSVHK